MDEDSRWIFGGDDESVARAVVSESGRRKMENGDGKGGVKAAGRKVAGVEGRRQDSIEATDD